jgi:hypothetical protein
MHNFFVPAKRQNPGQIAEQELPGMPPKGKRSSPAQKLQREIEEYTWAMRGETGPLIAQAVAAQLLGVSKQRVFQLVEAGRLGRWEFFNAPFVSLPEVVRFKSLQRPTGVRTGDAA